MAHAVSEARDTAGRGERGEHAEAEAFGPGGQRRNQEEES